MSARRCAVCWFDKKTRRRGTNDTTWICEKCKAKKENRYWKATPMDEYGVEDIEMAISGDPMPADSEPGKFETSSAIEVMKLYCMDVGTHDDIARIAGVTRPFASQTIAHWTESYGHTISKLREFFIGRTVIPIGKNRYKGKLT